MSDEAAEKRRSELLELQGLFLGLEDHQRAALLIVARELRALGTHACEVLTMQAERMAMGAAQYNDDFSDSRDWLLEALNEQLDKNTYLTRLLKIMIDRRDREKAAE